MKKGNARLIILKKVLARMFLAVLLILSLTIYLRFPPLLCIFSRSTLLFLTPGKT